MRFVYEKEFVRSGRLPPPPSPSSTPPAASVPIPRSRPATSSISDLASCTRSISARPVRRVLIVGAGLDLAPRTALLEATPPQSYQPWAVIDALVAPGWRARRSRARRRRHQPACGRSPAAGTRGRRRYSSSGAARWPCVRYRSYREYFAGRRLDRALRPPDRSRSSAPACGASRLQVSPRPPRPARGAARCGHRAPRRRLRPRGRHQHASVFR